jgi:hypothetical protein
MKLTYETLNLLMLLMPGLLSSIVYNLIRRKVETSTFEKIIESLLFTFVIYVVISFTYTWQPLATATKIGSEVTYSISNDLWLILLTLGYALAFPLILGSIVHHDLHMKFFRWANLTDRTSRDTAWDDVFTDEKRFITLHLEDARRISGWPLYYSNNKDEGFVYLSQAAWLDEKNEYIDSDSHGILISKAKIDLIEFMFNPDEEQGNEQEQTATE